MKKDYLSSFPRVRYSHTEIISDTKMIEYCGWLGGNDAAKYFLLKTEGDLNQTRRKIEVERHNNHKLYSECELKLKQIRQHSLALSILFKSMEAEQPSALDPKDWRTLQLLRNGISHWELDEWEKGFPPSLLEVAQYLDKVAQGASKGINSLKGKKGIVYNPINTFARTAIFNYENFFKKYPVVQRGSRFVEVIENFIYFAGIDSERRSVTTYKILVNELKKMKSKSSDFTR